ncbi:hypothetical protein SAMN04490369_11063 [Vreelandella aquamarina]|uniref:Uncharacterized protein n=1 Tax=Vreelandella aquamarina TaxID=77097 RepID=A0A1H8Q1B1_9GAMM|nr:hypothetical protein SAMN04490369_11063 [Halomonas aquamarina]
MSRRDITLTSKMIKPDNFVIAINHLTEPFTF